jgi:protein CpxP
MMMNKFRNSMLIGLAVAGIGFGSATISVMAADDNPASASASASHERRHGFFGKHAAEHMQARMAKKLAALHDKLNLIPAQEGAWSTFVESIKPPTPPDATARGAMHAELATLTSPERGDYMLTRLKQHEALLATKLEALKAFYAQLSPNQQNIFDDNFKPMDPGGPFGRHH